MTCPRCRWRRKAVLIADTLIGRWRQQGDGIRAAAGADHAGNAAYREIAVGQQGDRVVVPVAPITVAMAETLTAPLVSRVTVSVLPEPPESADIRYADGAAGQQGQGIGGAGSHPERWRCC